MTSKLEVKKMLQRMISFVLGAVGADAENKCSANWILQKHTNNLEYDPYEDMEIYWNKEENKVNLFYDYSKLKNR